MERALNRSVIIAGIGALLVLAILVWVNSLISSAENEPLPQNTSDTRVAAETITVTKPAPVDAEPTFVGRQVCRECHAENFALHAQHGHALSLPPRVTQDGRDPPAKGMSA